MACPACGDTFKYAPGVCSMCTALEAEEKRSREEQEAAAAKRRREDDEAAMVSTMAVPCQTSGCSNYGVFSCRECGKLVCGKHRGTDTLCNSCLSAQQRAADRDSKRYREAARVRQEAAQRLAVRIMLVGMPFVILGVVVLMVAPGWQGALVGFLGVVIVLGGAAQASN
jgi:hypothetical protein